METIYLCIIIFLFVLAVFDLIVGVSNDAVNFLNSAVGAKAASFKTILFIAGIGIFIGASLSNGMMDIARTASTNPSTSTLQKSCVSCLPSCSPTLSCWTYSIQWECLPPPPYPSSSSCWEEPSPSPSSKSVTATPSGWAT